jgi:hypothetical protein
MSDNVGLPEKPEADLYSVDARHSEALQVAPTHNRMSFGQVLDDPGQYSFRLKPDRRCRTRADVECDRRRQR